MKLTILVAGVTTDTWFKGTRDERAVLNLNCLDADAHDGLKLKQTFDYTPTQDEQKELDFNGLEGVKIVLAVEEIKAGAGGRLKMRGKIDRSTLPKANSTAPKAQTPNRP